MAPKRKGRPPSRTALSPSGNNTEDVTNVATTSNLRSRVAKLPADLQDDPWTDEQEAALFKGIVRWKPVGLHKHFRMICLSHHLQNYTLDLGKDQHLRVPGIWKKLGSLYNLDTLDERENVFDRGGSPDSEGYQQAYCQFALPKEDFGESMYQRRLADRASPSSSASESAPPMTAGSTSITATRRGSTVDDTEDPRSSPASTPVARATRTSRVARRTRRSHLNEVSSLQKRRDASKANMEGSPITQDDDRGESTEEVDEEEHDAREQATKSSNTNVARRRSTRRR